MRIPQIEKHLREKLPVIYPSFSSDFKEGVSASVSSDVMTLTVNAGHGIQTGDEIIVTGLDYYNPISSVTLNLPENKAIVTMSEVHEYSEGFSSSIIILGATESVWNNTFEIISVPSRYEVEIRINSSITAEPTGAPVANETNLPRYNSIFTVKAFDTLSIDVDVINAPNGSLVGAPSFILVNNINISSDVDLENILDSYTKQDVSTVWLFVVSGATSTSRTRNSNTDFEQSFQVGEQKQIHTQENISIFAIFPTHLEVTAVQAQDTARNELRNALFVLLVGYVPESSLTASSDMIYFVADGIETYNKSYYIHRYDFAANVDITPTDTYVGDSFAVRKINTDYINEDSLENIAQDKIDYTAS